MLKRIKTILVVMAAIVAVHATAQASPGVSNITGGADTANGGPLVLGWSFTPNQDMNIAALGIYAARQYIDGDTWGPRTLTQTHQVGLFNAIGTLMASATVTNNDGLYGMFRFHNLETVQHIDQGNLYYLAANIGEDQFILNPDNYVPANQITFGQFLNASGNDITAHLDYENLGDKYFGPNYETAPVPEPSTFLLLGAGLGGVLVLRRRVGQ